MVEKKENREKNVKEEKKAGREKVKKRESQ